MNKVILTGMTGKDVDLRYTPGGSAVATYSLATTDKRKDKSGVWVKETEWHNIVQFGKGAENAAQYVKKGSLIGIEGKIQTRSWEGKDGRKNYKTEIVAHRIEFLNLKRDENAQQGEPYPQAPASQQRPGPGADDDLPSDDPF